MLLLAFDYKPYKISLLNNTQGMNLIAYQEMLNSYSVSKLILSQIENRAIVLYIFNDCDISFNAIEFVVVSMGFKLERTRYHKDNFDFTK